VNERKEALKEADRRRNVLKERMEKKLVKAFNCIKTIEEDKIVASENMKRGRRVRSEQRKRQPSMVKCFKDLA
jgi:hypothetical protein